jgi:hypothetical protein
VNTYADACKALREAIEDYIDAATWELRHKMPPLDAIDLANATAQKAVGVIAHEASQRLASHIQVPDDLAQIFERDGGLNADTLGSDQGGAQKHAPAAGEADHVDPR